MAITGHTRVFALLGRPVTHSQSPALHNAAFAHHGVDAVYVCLDVHPDAARSVPAALRTLGLAGVNLTVPLKQQVLPGLDRVEGLAAIVGAVNTVVWDGDALVGHNTDGSGFVDGVRAAHGDVVRGRSAVVIGAGGAGLACGAGLAEAGASEVTWLNRSPARAEAAAARCAPAFPGVRFRGAGLDAFGAVVGDAAVVVQATSGDGAAAVASMDAGAVGQDAVWVDLNYWMPSPPLRDALVARGVRFQDGRPMLVHQAARAFRYFTGISPDPARMAGSIG